MKKRILVSLILISSVFILTSLLVATFVFHGIFEKNVSDRISIELNDLAIALDGGVPIDLLGRKDRRLTLLSEEGTVLFDSAADSSLMENHLGRKEIQEAKATGIGYDERLSTTLEHKQVYYAKRLSNGNILRISEDVLSVWAFLLIVSLPLALIVLVLVLLGFVFSSVLTNAIVAPLNRINLEEPEENDAYPELSPLLSRISCQKKMLREEVDKAEQKRKEFESISASMEEGLAIVNREGLVLTRNGSFDKLLGLSGQEKDAKVFSCCPSEAFSSLCLAAFHGEKGSVLEWMGEKCIEFSATPAEGGVILLLRDVTERVSRENLRKEFTANVSHELKTPLTTISGFAELMASGSVPPEKTVDFSHEILHESERLQSLVSDILNLSRLDEGRLPPFTKVSVSSVCSAVCRELEMAAERYGVSVESDIKPGLSVNADEKMVFQTVYNLLDNAIRYNRKGGRASLSLAQEEGFVLIAVEDNGIGIPPEAQDRVFERFYRVDKSRSKEKGGTGLGLSLVKNNVQLLHGHIELESKVGAGTRITVKLPLCRD